MAARARWHRTSPSNTGYRTGDVSLAGRPTRAPETTVDRSRPREHAHHGWRAAWEYPASERRGEPNESTRAQNARDPGGGPKSVKQRRRLCASHSTRRTRAGWYAPPDRSWRVSKETAQPLLGNHSAVPFR